METPICPLGFVPSIWKVVFFPPPICNTFPRILHASLSYSMFHLPNSFPGCLFYWTQFSTLTSTCHSITLHFTIFLHSFHHDLTFNSLYLFIFLMYFCFYQFLDSIRMLALWKMGGNLFFPHPILFDSCIFWKNNIPPCAKTWFDSHGDSHWISDLEIQA